MKLQFSTKADRRQQIVASLNKFETIPSDTLTIF